MKRKTRRQEDRYWRTRGRPVVVPERHIDRFYRKWKYERQPKLACNKQLHRYETTGRIFT